MLNLLRFRLGFGEFVAGKQVLSQRLESLAILSWLIYRTLAWVEIVNPVLHCKVGVSSSST